MRKLFIILGLLSMNAQAQTQTYITPSGTYMTSQVGSTTYVTPVARSSGSAPAVVMAAPASGSNTYVTPSGTYMTSRVGSTTYVIQTSKGTGRK
jgi:hypothetical protein